MHFELNLWGSHPDAENDDWWSSVRLAGDIRDALDSLASHEADSDTAYIELVSCEPDGMTRLALKENKGFVPYVEEACSEWAMLQGMAHGCDAYNDAMGWGVDAAPGYEG